MGSKQVTITVESTNDRGISVFVAEWIGEDALRFGQRRVQHFRTWLEPHVQAWQDRGYSVVVERS